MELGISLFNGVSVENQVKCFLKHGIKHTFIMSDHPDFEKRMELFRENGIICDNLHAPFKGINAMWGEDEEAAAAMLAKLTDSVDKCQKYGIPCTITHVSSGRPMPEITKQGIARYEYLFQYGKERGVKIVLENLRFAENLAYFMDNYDEPAFCWDNGHQYCCTPDVHYLKKYGHRLAALHIQDNRAQLDTDDHMLPFDGNIPMEEVARELAESGYQGTLMLEVGRNIVTHNYDDLTEEEYVDRAVAAVKKLNDLVESYR